MSDFLPKASKDSTKSFTTTKVTPKTKPSSSTSNEYIDYHCDICNKVFDTLRGWKLHTQFKHSINVDDEKKYQCQDCAKTFSRSHNLMEHKKMHLPSGEREWFGCPHCSKQFLALRYVTEHIRGVHDRILSFMCEQCGHAFANYSNLTAHRAVHSQKPFRCNECPAAYKSNRSLKAHLEWHAQTKFQCTECEKFFNTQNLLRQHMQIHADDKNFECNVCCKAFKRKKDLQYHLISHAGVEPYQCPFCSRSFTNAGNCRKHQRNFHPLKLARMQIGGRKYNFMGIPLLLMLVD